MNSSFLTEFREWIMLLLELGIFIYVKQGLKYEKRSAEWLEKEFQYDEQKDLEKKQKKTRTTKKTTQNKDGGTTVEESSEVTEPIQEEKK